MNRFRYDLSRSWLEWQGRNRQASRYSFPSNEIITPGVAMQVSSLWHGIYLNLHPAHFAIAIAPDGRVLNFKGGYNFPLNSGRYILHYVDKQNRVAVIPRVSETTSDRTQVSMELVFTYRVIDPIKALEFQQPVDTLIVFIQSDLKEFIRTHKYDEFVRNNDKNIIDNHVIAAFLREQHARRFPLSKLFFLSDIVIEETIGVSEFIEIRRQKKARVFISYARNDFNVASEIYRFLADHGFTPWMDKYDLVPGQDWQLEIQKKIKSSDYFIACLSNHSVSKVGFVQKELKEALSVLEEMPEGRIYLIPIKIDDCVVPTSLEKRQWLDWSDSDAKELLLRAIEV